MGHKDGNGSSYGQEASTGLLLSADDWIRNHFEACAREYEEMFRSLGVAPGAHVLDAGCGPGVMFPAIARTVGSSGRITGVDLVDRFLGAARVLAREQVLACDVEVRQASVADLPFPDDTFDVVWCANIIEYFDDAELDAVLREFRRVTRPGGMVAVKDWDGNLFRVHPAEPKYFWHLFEEAVRQDIAFATNVHGFFRMERLAGLFRAAGLENVWQSSTLIEHRAPLTPIKRTWSIQALEMFRAVSDQLDLPEEDRAFWNTLRDPHSPDHPIHRPDFLFGEANTMVVGQPAA